MDTETTCSHNMSNCYLCRLEKAATIALAQILDEIEEGK